MEKELRSKKELLIEYIRICGFPIAAWGNFDERSSYQIVEGIYNSVIISDITKRHQVKNFVIYRCSRYVLQGKSILKTQEKCYFADASLKYSIMGFSPKSIAAMLENIVYLELCRKGYEVYIGKNETLSPLAAVDSANTNDVGQTI